MKNCYFSLLDFVLCTVCSQPTHLLYTCVRRFQIIRHSRQINTQGSDWAQSSQSKELWWTHGARWGLLSIWGA